MEQVYCLNLTRKLLLKGVGEEEDKWHVKQSCVSRPVAVAVVVVVVVVVVTAFLS